MHSVRLLVDVPISFAKFRRIWVKFLLKSSLMDFVSVMLFLSTRIDLGRFCCLHFFFPYWFINGLPDFFDISFLLWYYFRKIHPFDHYFSFFLFFLKISNKTLLFLEDIFITLVIQGLSKSLVFIFILFIGKKVS